MARHTRHDYQASCHSNMPPVTSLDAHPQPDARCGPPRECAPSLIGTRGMEPVRQVRWLRVVWCGEACLLS